MTSRRSYIGIQNNKTASMSVFQTNPVGVEFFSYQTLSFVPIHLHRCWPRDWKRSIIVSRISQCIRKSVRNPCVWTHLWILLGDFYRGSRELKERQWRRGLKHFLKEIHTEWSSVSEFFSFIFVLISFHWEFFIYINIIITILTLIRDAQRDKVRDIYWYKH